MTLSRLAGVSALALAAALTLGDAPRAGTEAPGLAGAPAADAANPFDAAWTAPFGAPPADAIKPGHFVPAFEKAMAEQLAAIRAITAKKDMPSFADVEAMERAALGMNRVMAVFGNFNSSLSTPELQAVEREMSPRLSAHRDAIMLDPALFWRIDTLYQARETLGLTAEQKRVLEEHHKRFVRAGARLSEAERTRVTEINKTLATLGTQFRQNVLKDTADTLIVLDSAAQLAGLPQFAVDGAAKTAADAGQAGKWAISLQRPSVEPFLMYADDRGLREKAYKAWIARGDNGDAEDNNAIIAQLVALRLERAKLLGYESFAHFRLDDRMAKTPQAAIDLMERVWAPARDKAIADRAELAALAAKDGIEKLEAWDWRYYSEKLRKERHNLNDAEIKAYFTLDAMLAAQFDVATKLFGLTFVERQDIPVYHPDVRVWEVKKDGETIGVFYGDFFAREGKQSGAWASSFRGQHKLDGGSLPLILNNLNYTKPKDGEPALLSYDDAETLFHEFGHALHGLLSNVTYPSIAGTSTPTDFVEFPAQIYEHWLAEPAVLAQFARHFETGEAMKPEMIEAILAARNFSQGFDTVEFLASAFVDMDLHILSDATGLDVRKAEAATRARIGVPDEIALRHRPTHFLHLFSGGDGGYAAGYYSYMWSEVLDTDGFAAFKETGDIFNPEVAKRLHDYVYSAGGLRPADEAYRLFRGRDPDVSALLKHRGFDKRADPMVD
jgi:peptidyl-dipeptidase Dcp